MTPKTKRRLKWVAKCIQSGEYCVEEQRSCGWWSAHFGPMLVGPGDYKSKRQAIAACEKHFREKGSK